MKYLLLTLSSIFWLISCRPDESIAEKESALAGTGKKTWIVSKENDVAISRPFRGFAFYREKHFFQYFAVVTSNGKKLFRDSGSQINRDINQCNTTWDITGDTIFVSYPKIGRTPFACILSIDENKLSYKLFTRANHLNNNTLTAFSVPDTVSNMTLNCPPNYRFEATHEPVKMLD